MSEYWGDYKNQEGNAVEDQPKMLTLPTPEKVTMPVDKTKVLALEKPIGREWKIGAVKPALTALLDAPSGPTASKASAPAPAASGPTASKASAPASKASAPTPAASGPEAASPKRKRHVGKQTVEDAQGGEQAQGGEEVGETGTEDTPKGKKKKTELEKVCAEALNLRTSWAEANNMVTSMEKKLSKGRKWASENAVKKFEAMKAEAERETQHKDLKKFFDKFMNDKEILGKLKKEAKDDAEKEKAHLKTLKLFLNTTEAVTNMKGACKRLLNQEQDSP